MAVQYSIPASRHRVELVIQRSRFIASADYTPTVAGARAFVDEMRREFGDASHNVYAFAVGYGASVTHGMSDDGEPAGTAGRPALAVVQGSGLGDVCVVITRYFGGTKLGTGGLVKAYTEATRLVLEEIPRTIKAEKRAVRLTIPYHFFEPCKRLVETFGDAIAAEEFGPQVTLTATFVVDQLEGFSQALAEATSGQVTPEVLPD